MLFGVMNRWGHPFDGVGRLGHGGGAVWRLVRVWLRLLVACRWKTFSGDCWRYRRAFSVLFVAGGC